MGLNVDASNSCIPPSAPLFSQFPPLPTNARGEPSVIDGKGGRINEGRPLLLYASGRLVVVRDFGTTKGVGKSLVYRGHGAHVTCAKFSTSGCYVASADVRGNLRVWSYDNEEHLCKLDIRAMSGPVRDLSWDGDSKRLCVVGEASDSSLGGRVIQWDTGVTCGELGQHIRNRSLSCAFRKARPMRIVTGGGEDNALILNSGPPFSRTKDMRTHARGGVRGVRYSEDAARIASVGGDRRACFYDGKTLDLIKTMDDVHTGSILGCDWSRDGKFLLTCGADGKTKVIDVDRGSIACTWDIMQLQVQRNAALQVNHDKYQVRDCFGAMQVSCAYLAGDIPVSVGFNGEIAFLPKDDSTEGAQFLSGHQAPITCMAADHASSTLFTGDSDGIICVWNAQTGDCARISRQSDPLEAR